MSLFVPVGLMRSSVYIEESGVSIILAWEEQDDLEDLVQFSACISPHKQTKKLEVVSK